MCCNAMCSRAAPPMRKRGNESSETVGASLKQTGKGGLDEPGGLLLPKTIMRAHVFVQIAPASTDYFCFYEHNVFTSGG